jgi:hypothetical protein
MLNHLNQEMKGSKNMGNNLYKVLGSTLMVISGIIYTLERITAKISAAIVSAGHATNGHTINIEPNYPSFFGNFFVWFFLFVGFLVLAFGFPKSNNEN